MKITVDLKNIDVPNEVDGNPPENGIMSEATVGPGTTMIQTVNRNTIASIATMMMI